MKKKNKKYSNFDEIYVTKNSVILWRQAKYANFYPTTVIIISRTCARRV